MPISRATWGRPDGGLKGQAGRQTPGHSLRFALFPAVQRQGVTGARQSGVLGSGALAVRLQRHRRRSAERAIPEPSGIPAGRLSGALGSAVQLQSAKAKEILAKAGLSNVSFRLDVNNQPPYLDIAQALQASFAQGGVKVELVPGISSQVSTKVKALNYDATLTSWGRIISTLTPMPQPSPTTRKTAARRWPGAPTGRSRR